jgi:hypothetical protein
MADSSSNFIKLTLEEMTPKLSLIAKQKEIMKVWRKGEESTLYRAKDFSVLKSPESSDYLLSLFSEGKECDDLLIGQDVLFTFSLNESDYFSEGVVSKDDIHESLVIRLKGDFYRSEKRINERLLTFPHHQVYAYFKVLNEKDESNVIELKREEDKLYIDYKQRQKKELKEKLKKKISDVEDLVGFRALDISRSGIAFMVGEEETKYFNDKNKYSFYVLFDGDIFVVKGGSLIYKVDYVGGTGGVSKHKVGLNFNPVENLTVHITNLLRESSESTMAQKEFEEFVDD